MQTMMNASRVSLRVGWVLVVVLLALVTVGAFAQGGGGNRRTFVAGELLITVPHGTAQATVNTVAASVNADVVYSFGAVDFNRSADAYHLRIRGTAPIEDATTLSAVSKLKADARVKGAWPNLIRRPLQLGGQTAIPNDPRFNEQWNLQQIKMPQAWTLEKGESNVIIAVVDTGVDIDHPEFAGRFLPGINSDLQTNDPRPTGASIHGTHVAGIAMAQANNGIGIAGVVWDKVMLLPINAGTDSAGFTLAALTRAFQFIKDHKAANPDKQYVLNLSLGSDATTDTPTEASLPPDETAILALARSGVVVCAGAGNDFENNNPPFAPAYLATLSNNILCITGTNHLGARAYYSEARPYSTIAAPGGDARAGKLILSTLPIAQGSYGLEQGTSMAAPHATGAAALLLSVPGVSPANVRDILTSTAQPVSGFKVPSPEFGYGIMDVNAALLKVAISVTIVEPEGTGGKAAASGQMPPPIETLRPTIRIHVMQVTPDNLVIKLDGITIPKDTPNTSGVFYTIPPSSITLTTTDQNGNTIPLIYDAVILTDLAPGQHTVEVSGTKPLAPPVTVSDIRYITITPHAFPAGRSLVSIPYFQDTDRNGHPLPPEQLLQYYLGNNFRLARWQPDLQRYVFSSSFGITEPGFIPASGFMPRQDGTGTQLYPLGLAFWSDAESSKPILTRGVAETGQPIVIPLRGAGSNGVAWAMVGDPFPFDVGFNSLLVDTPEGRLTIQQASDKGYLLPNLYAFDGTTGYIFRSLPDGVLSAWNGYWIGVTSPTDIALVVPPVKITRAASLPTRASVGTGGWELRLSASVRDLRDTYNFIGVSSRAADGYDRNKVPKPPMVSPFVTLGIRHDDWGRQSGLYAQDVRAQGGKKTWDVSINTDQPDSSVSVTWNPAGSLPRNLKLTIKDEATGQVADMRTRSSLTFNSGSSPSPHRFTITASTQVSGFPRISNLSVRPSGGSRAAGTANVIEFTLSGDATYEVKILSATGGTVGTVASRAASAGDQRLIWNGKDAAGRSVAAGTYLVQVRAISPDGEVVRVIQPFAVLR
jgi:subtilisin family serine protease